MSFCSKCGNELKEGAAFCDACGAPVAVSQPEPMQAEQVIESQVIPTEPVNAADNAEMYAEEKECLDNYYKLLKWERVAWSITGKVFLILGIILVGLFAMIAMFAFAEEPILGGFMLVYAMVYGAIFFPFAIVNLKMVGKTQYYMDTLYTDIRPTVERCGSIGMIVLSCIFGVMSPVFFIINFARTKGNKHITDRIIAHQQGR